MKPQEIEKASRKLCDAVLEFRYPRINPIIKRIGILSLIADVIMVCIIWPCIAHTLIGVFACAIIGGVALIAGVFVLGSLFCWVVTGEHPF